MGWGPTIVKSGVCDLAATGLGRTRWLRVHSVERHWDGRTIVRSPKRVPVRSKRRRDTEVKRICKGEVLVGFYIVSIGSNLFSSYFPLQVLVRYSSGTWCTLSESPEEIDGNCSAEKS